MHVVSVALPKPRLIPLHELYTAQPLRALPRIKLRYNQPSRPTVIERDRLAVMRNRHQRIISQKFRNRQIGCKPVVVPVCQHELRPWRQPARPAHQFPRRNSLPNIPQPAPPRDAMKIGKHFNTRQFAEFLPVPLQHLPDSSEHPQLPRRQVDPRRPARIQDRPLPRSRLSRRNPLLTSRIRADHCPLRRILRCRYSLTLLSLFIHPEAHRCPGYDYPSETPVPGGRLRDSPLFRSNLRGHALK